MHHHAPQPILRTPIAALPRNAEDFLQPFSVHGALPERAQAYLSLLAESTTTPGAMQKVWPVS